MSRAPDHRPDHAHASPHLMEEPALATEEIEALLREEPLDPEAEKNGPRETHHIVMREPGRGFVGKLLVWLLVAFICMNIYMRW